MVQTAGEFLKEQPNLMPCPVAASSCSLLPSYLHSASNLGVSSMGQQRHPNPIKQVQGKKKKKKEIIKSWVWGKWVWHGSCPGETPSAIRAGAGVGLCSTRE